MQRRAIQPTMRGIPAAHARCYAQREKHLGEGDHAQGRHSDNAFAKPRAIFMTHVFASPHFQHLCPRITHTSNNTTYDRANTGRQGSGM
eukprot:15433364-Alexandrium_andersonii.AAC.2